MYQIEIRLASKNGWFTPDEARRYYGKYARTGVTLHWWNSPDKIQDNDHDNIVNYMLGNASRGVAPTVNYVLSNNKITMTVNPDNVAWTSGNGNATTVGVEISPHLNSEGYKKLGWLINELEGRYGRTLQLFKHSDWMQTACPGTISPTRARQEADKWKRGDYNPKPPVPVPVPPSTPVVDEWVRWKEGPQVYVANKQPTNLYDFNSESWSMKVIATKNKGEQITIVGQARNTRLNRVYYLTEYSFSRKITNGFHPADLDVYVAPRPLPEPVPTPDPNPPVPEPPYTPEPPTPTPTPDPTPTPEPEPDRNAIIAFLTMLKDLIVAFLGKFKR